MASYKVFYLLFIACHVCIESEAASVPPTYTTAHQRKSLTFSYLKYHYTLSYVS